MHGPGTRPVFLSSTEIIEMNYTITVRNYDKLTKQLEASFETLRTNPLTSVDEGSHIFILSQYQIMMVSYVMLWQR